MSVDTTAKPLPNSPARAASTEPLTASMLVWIDTVLMASTILSMRRLICSSAVICSRLLRPASTDIVTPAISSSTATLLTPNRSLMAWPLSSPAWARVWLICAPFSIWAMAAADSWLAALCCWAPLPICSSAVMICAAARLISSTALDSSSAAEATSSALLVMSLEFFNSSASSDSSCAVCSLWVSAWAC